MECRWKWDLDSNVISFGSYQAVGSTSSGSTSLGKLPFIDLLTDDEFDHFSTKTTTSETNHAPGGASEPVIGLKLGKRTYFEDDNTKQQHQQPCPSSSNRSNRTENRSIPRCMVEGCGVDLSSAKAYHRKHKVCDTHSKSSRVVVGGHQVRFCQQCSKFHALAEFDQEKRSCRRRLYDHNIRRRKPQVDAMPMLQSELNT